MEVKSLKTLQYHDTPLTHRPNVVLFLRRTKLSELNPFSTPVLTGLGISLSSTCAEELWVEIELNHEKYDVWLS